MLNISDLRAKALPEEVPVLIHSEEQWILICMDVEKKNLVGVCIIKEFFTTITVHWTL